MKAGQVPSPASINSSRPTHIALPGKIGNYCNFYVRLILLSHSSAVALCLIVSATVMGSDRIGDMNKFYFHYQQAISRMDEE